VSEPARGFDIVVAADDRLGIARGGDLPWRLPGDLAHFKKLTTAAPPGQRNAVFMGRTTWESIPPRFRPLPDRLNLVLTRRADYPVPDGVLVAPAIDAAVALLAARPEVADIFCVGGGAIYTAAVEMPACRRIYITRVAGDFACDTFFPRFEHLFERARVMGEGNDGGVAYRIEVWERRG